jgi:hypothetical protein
MGNVDPGLVASLLSEGVSAKCRPPSSRARAMPIPKAARSTDSSCRER